MSRTHKYLLDKIFHEGGGCFYYSLFIQKMNASKKSYFFSKFKDIFDDGKR